MSGARLARGCNAANCRTRAQREDQLLPANKEVERSTAARCVGGSRSRRRAAISEALRYLLRVPNQNTNVGESLWGARISSREPTVFGPDAVAVVKPAPYRRPRHR